MENEVQYDLDRKAAEISELPSKNLSKYEHLTGEDLDTNQVHLNKLDLIILYWVQFSVND